MTKRILKKNNGLTCPVVSFLLYYWDPHFLELEKFFKLILPLRFFRQEDIKHGEFY